MINVIYKVQKAEARNVHLLFELRKAINIEPIFEIVEFMYPIFIALQI
jgi:hypothetical protein